MDFFVAKDNPLIFKDQTKLVILPVHDGSHGICSEASKETPITGL